MKVVYIQDMDPLASQGGAQLTDKTLIYEGLRRGHRIEILVPETFHNDYNADLVLISNATRFDPRVLRPAEGKTPYVVFHHDYNYCRFRLYFPLQEKCKSCPYLPAWRKLFDEAQLNIFMSPLHRDAYLAVAPELSDMPNELCPSLLDPAEWPKSELSRTAGTVLAVNSLVPYKGRANVLAYAEKHPALKFTMAGASEGEGDIPPNASHIGLVTDAKLRELYGTHERFIHLPPTPMPSERTCIEARLSGCGMILNPLVGITSYRQWELPDDEFRSWLATRAENLWKVIEKL